ncbi:fimbria/pilus outer membrane usher protein [Aquisediminimonas profunda]|uniref:fimbria/pilus outer membrane usher protein n=1 Tax=Aquisediminimonas profunda TaxID=1550733 RepID=UPI001C62C87F|nr:fimbria/pilus outer membrane usher protein [Aquisediminimonas profunda]
MVRRLRLLSTALGTMAGSALPGGAAVAATPRLPIDPAAFSDDSLAYPPPRLDYDPDVLGMACAPGASGCLDVVASNNLVAASDVPETPGTGTQVLALSPSVNDEAQSEIFAVQRSETGAFSITAADLRSARIKVPSNIPDADYVALSSLPGVTARYDEASQGLALDVPDPLRVPLELAVTKPRDKVDLSKLSTQPNVQLNYRLLASSALSGVGRDTLDGDAVLVVSNRFAQLVNSATFGTGVGFVRGETVARLEDPYKVRTYALGDVITGAVGFSDAVRLGGFQVQSNFQQRPDIFRGPLPQFAASAALPSAVDLYVDSLKVFSTNVPRGPFVLQSLPQLSGRTLSVVTTDLSGRQTRISKPYYYAPGLLRHGVSEYSFELGFPRLGGSSTLGNYLDFLATSAAVRYGLTDRFTIEGHAEAGGGLINGGGGFAAALGYFGSLNGSLSASRFKGKDGARATLDYQVGLGGISGFASIVREFGTYTTLGDVTTIRGLSVSPAGFQLRRAKESIDRAGIFFQLPFDPTTIDLAYNRLNLGFGKTRTASAGFTRRINDRLSLNGTMLVDLERNNAISARINLNIRLGSFATATVGGDHVPGRNTYAVTVNGFNAGRQNQLGYSLSQRGDDEGNATRSGRLDYRLPQVLLSTSIDQSRGNVRGQLAAEGAILFADKRLFPANRIGESFALIKNAGPGAEILQNGRRIARSDKNGNALLPELEAFDETRISLDPTRLPTDFEARNGTEFNIVTSRRNGALIDFGVRKVFAGIVVIVDKDGKPFPPGTQVLRDGFDPEVMGYDGEVFLRDLKPINEITIDRGEAGLCKGSFAYAEKDAEQPRIGPVTCQ